MIDNKIEIDESLLPDILKNIIRDLEKYEKENDEDNYMDNVDLLEINAKSFVLNNKIAEDMFYKLMKKYGGLVD